MGGAVNTRPEPIYDDEGRCIRPAFLDGDDHLTIFRDHVGRRNYIERNGYVVNDGLWQADGLPNCRDVLVREGRHDLWELVPEAEAAALRDTVVPVP